MKVNAYPFNRDIVKHRTKSEIVKLLALALINMVLDLANLVTKWQNLAKTNLVTNQTTLTLTMTKSRPVQSLGHPTTKLFQGGILEFLLSDGS